MGLAKFPDLCLVRGGAVIEFRPGGVPTFILACGDRRGRQSDGLPFGNRFERLWLHR